MRSAQYMKDYQLKNKEKIKQKKHENYLKNKESYQAKMKLYRETSDFDFKGYALKYQEQNKEKLAKYRKEYKSLNKHKVNANNARRRAAKISRTPKWLTKDHLSVMNAIFSLAQNRTKWTGKQHHVDHIVPLMGETVSGLHVPWNLQVIESEENIKKSNLSWPECW